MENQSLHRERIRSEFITAGFDLVAFTDPSIPSDKKKIISDWIHNKHYGDMDWFAKRNQIRFDYMDLGLEVKSVVVLGSYYFPEGANELSNPEGLKISLYAQIEDYHSRLKGLALPVLSRLRTEFPNNRFRQGVDSLPLAEKVLAEKSGLGWMGKHTCILNQQFGSYIFLSIILTDLVLELDEPVQNRCGRCRKCLDACPTGALTESYKLDARKCISYLTIEKKHRDGMDHEKNSGYIFGCDICQDVCPWNKKCTKGKQSGVFTINEFIRKNYQRLPQWKEEDFLQASLETPLKRINYERFRENFKSQ